MIIFWYGGIYTSVSLRRCFIPHFMVLNIQGLIAKFANDLKLGNLLSNEADVSLKEAALT